MLRLERDAAILEFKADIRIIYNINPLIPAILLFDNSSIKTTAENNTQR